MPLTYPCQHANFTVGQIYTATIAPPRFEISISLAHQPQLYRILRGFSSLNLSLSHSIFHKLLITTIWRLNRLKEYSSFRVTR